MKSPGSTDASSRRDYRPAVVMFTDIHNFSRMLDSDQRSAMAVLEHNGRLINDLVKEHGGTVIKTVADTFQVEFAGAITAVECAQGIQNRLYEENEPRPGQERYELRVGIHLGDIWFFEDEALGDAITIAARLQNLATPGRICISADVLAQIQDRLEADVVELGTVELKEIGREIPAYEILTRSARAAGEDTRRPAGPPEPPQAPGPPEGLGPSEGFSPLPSEAPAAPRPLEGREIQDAILEHIRSKSRHVPVEEIVSIFPEAGKKIASVMRRLEERGILTRIDKADGSVEYGLSELKLGRLMGRLTPLSIGVNEGGKSRQIRVDGRGIHIWDGRSERQVSIGKGGMRLTRPHGLGPAEGRVASDQPDTGREDLCSVPVDLINHAAAYGLVNGLLLLLNAVTGPSFGHPWFLYPAGAWMIGLASHATAAVFRGRHRRENAARLPAEQRRALKKLQAQERSFAGHATAFLTVNGFLFMIYLLTSPGGFPWPLIPAAGWGIGFVFHWINSAFRRRRLRRRLEKAGVNRRELRRNAAEGSMSGAASGSPSEWDRSEWGREPYVGLVAEAHRIKQGLVRELESSKDVGAEWRSDLAPLLETYFNQIRELQERSRELRRTAQEADMSHVTAELRVLLRKRERTASEQLKAEYEESIKACGRQLKAYEELCTEQEIIDLRLKSAVMMLKRLQMDFARIKNVSALSDQDVLSQVKRKTRELTQYLDDLRSSYAELEEEL